MAEGSASTKTEGLIKGKQHIKMDIESNTQTILTLTERKTQAMATYDCKQVLRKRKLNEDICRLKKQYKRDKNKLQHDRHETAKVFDKRIKEMSDKVEEQKHVVVAMMATSKSGKKRTSEIKDGGHDDSAKLLKEVLGFSLSQF